MVEQTTLSADESRNTATEEQVTLGSFGNGGEIERKTVPSHKNPRWLRTQYHTHGKSIPEIAVEAGVPGGDIVNRMNEFGIPFLGPKIPIDAARKLYSERWLREQYIERRKELVEMADEIGVSRTPIKKSLEQYEIELRSEPEIKLSKEALEKLEDENWLREEYVENRRSTTDIASEIGVFHGTVGSWLERHGIEIRSQLEAQQSESVLAKLTDEGWLREQYVENKRSTVDIASEVGVHNAVVGKWLKRHSIEVRSMAEAHLPEPVIEKLEDADWMYEQYVEKRRSTIDIGDEIGVGESSVAGWLRRHDIEIRSASEAKLPKGAVDKLQKKEWLFHQYIELERTSASIADEVDVHSKTVLKSLKEHGIEIRSGFQDPEHLDHVVRSGWEMEIVELLREHNIPYEYESVEIDWGEEQTYRPDFITEDYIIEVKGWVRPQGNEEMKAQAALELLDDREYVVVGAELPCDIHIPWEDYEKLIELIKSHTHP
jgi:transposase-like protein